MVCPQPEHGGSYWTYQCLSEYWASGLLWDFPWRLALPMSLLCLSTPGLPQWERQGISRPSLWLTSVLQCRACHFPQPGGLHSGGASAAPGGHNDSELDSTSIQTRLLAFLFLVRCCLLDRFPLVQSFLLSDQAQAVEQSHQMDGHSSHFTLMERHSTCSIVKFFCFRNAADSWEHASSKPLPLQTTHVCYFLQKLW